MPPNIDEIFEEYEVVPWRSREEWLEVQTLILSDELPKLEKAYEKLRCWKVRCHRLPAGIECTLLILEPILSEENLKNQNDGMMVQSAYALAITRFLNTVASFGKEKVPTTLYKIARNLSIPEWIVNIRHEAAHSPDLPSLDVLQAGAQFSLQWLRSVYWENGLAEDEPEGDLVPKANLRDQLQKWCEFYKEVYSQKLKNIHLTKDIKDIQLVQKVKEYLLDYNGSMSDDDDDDLETPTWLQSTINVLMDQLIIKLNSIYNEAIQKKYVIEKILRHFLEVSEFLPSERAWKKYISERDEAVEGTTWHMRKMWSKVIRDVFQNNGVLLQFMKELVNYNSGDHFKNQIASFWVREIARGIVLAQVALLVGVDSTVYKKPLFYNKDEESEIYKKAKKIYNSNIWENNIKLSLNKIPTTDDLVENIILYPRTFTRVYLSDLLETTKRKLSENKKRKILKLVDLILNQTYYTGNHIHVTEKIYSISKAGEECNLSMDQQLEQTYSGVTNIWNGVPIGSLPF